MRLAICDGGQRWCSPRGRRWASPKWGLAICAWGQSLVGTSDWVAVNKTLAVLRGLTRPALGDTRSSVNPRGAFHGSGLNTT